MKRKTLTAEGVARVRPLADPRRRRMDWDAVVPGLALRTTTTGSKSWVLVTRYEGRVVFATLGKPPGITLPAARDLAREGLARVSRGDDPRQRAASEPPVRAAYFEGVAAEFIERWAKARNRTWRETERQLAKYVTPKWKGRRLAEIGRADVVALIDEIANTAPIQANRVLAVVKKLFSWALDRGLIDVHPVARLAPPSPEQQRTRVLTDAEVKALWKACTTMGYPWGTALQLLLLTATRRGEVEAMTWDELDLDAHVWTVPAGRVKTKLPLLVPLSPPAVALLERAPRFDGCPYVFTTRRNKHAQDWSGAVATATEKSGVNGWRVHDLRRTVRTGLSRLGVASDIGERVLGHTVRGVRAVYDRFDYLPEKRDALMRWASYVTALVARDG